MPAITSPRSPSPDTYHTGLDVLKLPSPTFQAPSLVRTSPLLSVTSVTNASPSFTIAELWSLYDFEVHARQCAICSPRYLSSITTITTPQSQTRYTGHDLAQLVITLIYAHAAAHTSMSRNNVARIQLPSGYTLTTALIRKVEADVRRRRQEDQTSKHKNVRSGPISFTLNTTDGNNPQTFYVSNPAPPAPEVPTQSHARQPQRPHTRSKPAAEIETPVHTLRQSVSHRRIVSAPASMAMASLGLGTSAQEEKDGGDDDDTLATTVPGVKVLHKAGSEKSEKSMTKTSVRSASTGGGHGARGSRTAWEGAVERRRSKSPTTSAVAKKSAGVRWPWLLT